MKALEKNFTDADKQEINALSELIHKIVQMRIQKYVRADMLKNDPAPVPVSPALLSNLQVLFERKVDVIDAFGQRNIDEKVSSICLAEAKRLMYVWVGLLKFIKAENGLPKKIKITDLFTMHDLPLPVEMLQAAVDASNILFMEDEDVKCIFSKMAEIPWRQKVVSHLYRILYVE